METLHSVVDYHFVLCYSNLACQAIVMHRS